VAAETRRILHIKIGDRFRKDLGDIDTLCKSIQDIGLLQPIGITEENKLVYGARRLEACKKLGWTEIPVNVIPIKDIINGEFHENVLRKNFNVSERVAILEEIESKRIGHKLAKGAKLAPFQEQEKGKKSREIAARYTGVSPAQLAKEKKLVQITERNPDSKVFEDILEKVDKGKMKVSKAYVKVMRFEKRSELMRDAKENNNNYNNSLLQHLPIKGCELIHGDFREKLKDIHDNSIDMIFCDPPYREQDLSIYNDLAKFAARVLKPGGSVVTFAGQLGLPRIFGFMEQSNLKYWWPFCVKHNGRWPKVWKQKMWVDWKPLLWFVKACIY
jgi:16S rRNA G966 N2-methylase RsmD